MLATLLSVLSLTLLAAHGLRTGDSGVALFWLTAAVIIFSPWQWKHLALAGLLGCGAWLWVDVTISLALERSARDLPWLRMAGILAVVTTGCLVAALLHLQRAYRRSHHASLAQGAVFLLTVAGLALASHQVPAGLLLADRFLPGSGWLVILLLGCYGAQVTGRMLDPAASASCRRTLWTLFSAVFFCQLLLGLFGFERFLMSGELHLPVPALILAGPLYRGEGLFMVVLFSTTLVLAGPAWCSHLCYIGAWDNLAANSRSRPSTLPAWSRIMRWLICLAVLAAAILLGRSTMPISRVILLATAFGLGGLLLMLTWSRRSGVMTHCTTYCPMGLVANLLGRINPWRIRIHSGCNQCGLCHRACRYGALTPPDLLARRPGLNCTLCGDCISACPRNHLHYHFPGLRPQTARTAFIVTIVTLHAIFLGVARL